MVAKVAEKGEGEPETNVEEFVGSWVEMEAVEHDLGVLEDIGCS